MAGVLSALLLEAFTTEHDTEANLKRGLKWVCGMALLVMTLNFNDGPFFRPHPAVWRLVLAATVLYELFLVLLLFQAPRDGRWLFSFYDPVLGPPLVAETYAETCDLYLPDAPEGPFAHLSHAIFDIFVIGHLFGWWVKSMIFRSYWVCWVMSVNFELLEMSLAFQLPNFNECWWDSWLLDVLICNGLGIYLGMKTGEWLEMRKYRFENVWQIPTLTFVCVVLFVVCSLVFGGAFCSLPPQEQPQGSKFVTTRGKMKRAANQLMPMSWTHFEWRPSQSLNSWLGVLSIMLFSVAVELNAFYLKVHSSFFLIACLTFRAARLVHPVVLEPESVSPVHHFAGVRRRDA
jgi:phosphatidylserine synthase 2